MFSRVFTRSLTRAVPALLMAGTGMTLMSPTATAEQCEMPTHTVSAKAAERTFIAIKPDGVQVSYDFIFQYRVVWQIRMELI